MSPTIPILLWSAVLGYALGSIPFAYFLVKLVKGLDIRRAGSGNVGALNSFLVTRSHALGGAVLAMDLLKGVAAVELSRWLVADAFGVQAVAGCAAVLGHNYPVWLGGHGGRGLATAAGVMLLLAPVLVAFWGALWLLGFALLREVNMGSALATVLLGVAVALVPWPLVRMAFLHSPAPGESVLFVVVLFTLLLLRLWAPVREYWQQRR